MKRTTRRALALLLPLLTALSGASALAQGAGDAPERRNGRC